MFRKGASKEPQKFTNNVFQQNLLLKALTHTSDLDELKKVANFHSKNEVLRTLDKLAIRKDYHSALVENGLDMNMLVSNLKDIIEKATKDETRLHGIQTILKSVGLEKYETAESEGKDWEGLLLKINEKEQADRLLPLNEQPILEGVVSKYDVVAPEVPESAKKKREEDDEIGKSIYE